MGSLPRLVMIGQASGARPLFFVLASAPLKSESRGPRVNAERLLRVWRGLLKELRTPGERTS